MEDRSISLKAAIEVVRGCEAICKAGLAEGTMEQKAKWQNSIDACQDIIAALFALPTVEPEFICKKCGLRTDSSATIAGQKDPLF